MQKQTYSQEFVDSELLDTLKRHYYFLLEEKFRLFQRASFLFVLLVPMFAILLNLFDTYKEPQPLVILFLFLLTLTLFCSIVFIFMSMFFRKYRHIVSPEKITQFYNKYKAGLIMELALEYTEASIVNKKIIASRAIYLWFAHLSVAIFAGIVQFMLIINLLLILVRL